MQFALPTTPLRCIRKPLKLTITFPYLPYSTSLAIYPCSEEYATNSDPNVLAVLLTRSWFPNGHLASCFDSLYSFRGGICKLVEDRLQLEIEFEWNDIESQEEYREALCEPAEIGARGVEKGTARNLTSTK